MNLKDEGTTLALKGFRGWMTRFAIKRPDGLVARFRKRFGLESEAEQEAAHKRFLEMIQKSVDEYQRKGSK